MKSDPYLKVIDEEDNLNKNNENDLTMHIQGDITSRNGNFNHLVNGIIIGKNEDNKNKGNQEIIFSQKKNNNNDSNNINNNDN